MENIELKGGNGRADEPQLFIFYFSFFIKVALCLLYFLPVRAAREFTLLQWNIWQEGTQVAGGYEAIVEEIVRLKPDFVTLSEVRNYHGTSFAARITRSLRERGENYYSFYSYDSGLLSRYPITDSLTVFPCEGDHGSIYRLTCEAQGVKWAVYTAHLDYQNDTYYEVRGYDGNTWRETAILTDTAEILRRNALSQRETAIRAFLAQAEKDEQHGYRIILGGDFNEPSLYDWVECTRYVYDHHGVVVSWPVTRMLHEAGYVDTWRAVHPDPLTHPGFTYPADNAAVQPSRLTWAPRADERERIDYLFVKGEGISVSEAKVFGPQGCIVYNQRHRGTSTEPRIEPLGVWPTDHKGVWAKIKVTP